VIKKLLLSFLLAGILILTLSKNSYAALIVVNKNGEVIWGVLGSEIDATLPIPRPKNLEVKNVAQLAGLPTNAEISLAKDNGKVELSVTTDSGRSKTDVTSYKDDLVEIETTDESKKVKITTVDGAFVIAQEGITAKTVFPITINAPEKRILVETSSGKRFLSILPYDAVSGIFKANILKADGIKSVDLKESDKGELEYGVDGKKEISLFNIISFEVPIQANISASTGEILKLEMPVWYKILGFVFT